MRAVDPGFAPNHVTTLALDLPATRYRTIDDLRAFHDAILARLRSVPGLRRAAAADFVPFGHEMFAGQVTLSNGRQWPQDGMAYKMFVTPGYFEVMGIRLRAGRLLTDQDDGRTAGVAIVSASVAREAWPGQNPIGQRMSEHDHPKEAADWLTIVGVVDDVKQSGPREERPLAIYRPYRQATKATVTGQPSLLSRTAFVLRTAAGPYDIASSVRTSVRDVDKDLPMPALQSMDDLMAQTTATPLFQARLLGAFAGLGLLLTVVGIYGVLAYSVSRRTREFGIRMALGANRRRLLAQVIRQSAILTMMGIGAGAIGTMALTNTLRSFLFEVTPTDPQTLLSVALLLVVVAIAAAIVPALRASAVDPVTALRAE
jgi:putative ABC transport system permease protein